MATTGIVAVEGIDGAGKSSVTEAVGQAMVDHQLRVLQVREPGGTLLGEHLRAWLKGEEPPKVLASESFAAPTQELLLATLHHAKAHKHRDLQGALSALAMGEPWTTPMDLDAEEEVLLFCAARAELAEQVLRPALRNGRWILQDRSVYTTLAYQCGGRGVDRVWAGQQCRIALDPDCWPSLMVLVDVDADVAAQRRNADASREGDDRIEQSGETFFRTSAEFYRELAADIESIVLDGNNDKSTVAQQAYQQMTTWLQQNG